MAASHSATDPNLTILIIAILGILATAFLLLTYYAIVAKCCNGLHRSSRGLEVNLNWNLIEQGLEESAIKSIPVIRLKDGLIRDPSSDCSVCLSDFREEDYLRMLPRCAHAFHLECIDSWLRTHKTCPLCRANVLVGSLDSSPVPGSDPHGVPSTDQSGSERGPSAEGLSDEQALGSAGMSRQLRALSDVVDPQRRQKRKKNVGLELGSKEEEESSFQAVRRSFSMDSCPYRDLAVEVGERDGEALSASRRHGFLFFGNKNAILPL